MVPGFQIYIMSFFFFFFDDFPMPPDVSTAAGWKMKGRRRTAYQTLFLTSAASTTDPAASEARLSFEDPWVLTHVGSQRR